MPVPPIVPPGPVGPPVQNPPGPPVQNPPAPSASGGALTPAVKDKLAVIQTKLSDAHPTAIEEIKAAFAEIKKLFGEYL